jgi:eukaryotic-like serine/threonine-protein kinase
LSRDPASWARIQALFHEALALPAGGRRAFLERVCADRPELVDEVLDLLAEDERTGSILERDVAALADDVLDGSVPPLGAVGPYTIQGILGRGGMGVVYLAVREDLGSRAAIKVLRDASLSPSRRERFAHEQRTLAQLSHPSIARLYDADTLPDGTPFFVMEYVEGAPLTAYCRSRQASLEDRLRLFRAVCVAVQAAHRQAVVHRDLKPSNILVTPAGEPKLLDFGIAKQLEELDTPAHQTETALRLMTPAYAAPEQVMGGPVGTYTDIYALGVILYELLAGRLPFDLSRRTPGQAEAVVLDEEPERPSLAWKEATDEPGAAPPVPRRAWPDLDMLTLTAMHKDPARRYPTVDALVRDVDHFLRGEPLEARPDTVAYRMRKFARRRWRPLAAAATAGVVVLGLVAFYTVRLARARDEAVAEAARAQRIQRFTLNLFTGGDEDTGPADSLHVVTLLDRGIHEARVLDAEPDIQAELYQTLGSIYEQMGNLDRADSLLQAALTQRRGLYGPDHPEVAKSLVALGLLRVDQAKLDEGEQLIRQGLEQTRRRYPADHPSVVEAETALGRLLQERGRYDEAAAVLDSAVHVLAAKGPSLELATSMEQLANTDFYAGRLAASDSLNRIVLQMDRDLYGERHPSVADGLINLGAIQFQLGDYARAEALYRQALDIIESYYGPDHPETASSLTMLGRALAYEDKYDEAVQHLRRALTIEERVYGPVHPAVASTLNDLGVAALQTGHPQAAEQDYQRMMDIYQQVYGGKHYLYALAEANLASAYLAEERYPEAERYFRRAVALFGETLPPDHQQTAIARIKLGRVLAREHRWAEAESVLWKGYATLSAQTSPSVSWLKSARTDLATIYDSLGRPADAARMRAAAADTGAAGPGGPPGSA